jgi:fructoselysine-6-P-deglycase FrlB-like protein
MIVKKIYQDKEYDDVYGFNNEEAKSLNDSIEELQKLLDDKRKQLKELQSNCSHLLYLSSRGVGDDCFICSECGYKFWR